MGVAGLLVGLAAFPAILRKALCDRRIGRKERRLARRFSAHILARDRGSILSGARLLFRFPD